MSRPVGDMAGDLEKAMAEHRTTSLESMRETAREMAASAEKLSSPLYGVKVVATSLDTPEGAAVRATTTRTPGFGTVYGGVKAAEKAVENAIHKAAVGGNLD